MVKLYYYISLLRVKGAVKVVTYKLINHKQSDIIKGVLKLKKDESYKKNKKKQKKKNKRKGGREI